MPDPRDPRDIESLARQLERDIEPARELWPQIATALAAELERLEAAVGALEREVPPRRDLWPEIRARIERSGRAGGRPGGALGWFAMAASLAATAMIASLFVLVGSERSLQPAPVAALDSNDAWWIALVDRTPRANPRHAAELTDVLGLIRTQYMSVRDERVEIEAALDRDPSSSMLAALWRHAYEQELALTARAQEIADAFERG
jgi:hypothetical protein